MSDKNSTDDDDIKLFRQAVGRVDKVKINTVVHKPKRKKVSSAKLQPRNKYVDHHIDEFIPEEFRVNARDHIEFKRPGIQNRVFQKLKRGDIPVRGQLDLHGMTANEAKTTLYKYLSSSGFNATQSCVRIIHGKGTGSQNGLPRLKQLVQIWLREHNKVLAYSSCLQKDGGTGAIYLLLKSG